MRHLELLAVAFVLVASAGCKKKQADEGTATGAGTGSAMVAPADAADLATPDAGTGVADGDGGMMTDDGGMADAGDGDGGMAGSAAGSATP